MITCKMCGNCSHFSHVQGLMPYGEEGRIIFFCPGTNDFHILGEVESCTGFLDFNSAHANATFTSMDGI